MASTLDQLAGVARLSFQTLLPRPPRSRSSRALLARGEEEQQGGQPEAVAEEAGRAPAAWLRPWRWCRQQRRLPGQQAQQAQHATQRHQQGREAVRMRSPFEGQQAQQAQQGHVAIELPSGGGRVQQQLDANEQPQQPLAVRTVPALEREPDGSASLQPLHQQQQEEQQQEEEEEEEHQGAVALEHSQSLASNTSGHLTIYATLEKQATFKAGPARPPASWSSAVPSIVAGSRTVLWMSAAVPGPACPPLCAVPRAHCWTPLTNPALALCTCMQVLGAVYSRMLPEGWATAGSIVAMLQLNSALKFGEPAAAAPGWRAGGRPAAAAPRRCLDTVQGRKTEACVFVEGCFGGGVLIPIPLHCMCCACPTIPFLPPPLQSGTP